MGTSRYTFRQAQSAFDLISILQSLDNARLIELGGDMLVRIVHGSSCRFENPAAGFRHLYEASKEFMWYSEKTFWNPVEAPESMIQFVGPPDDSD